MAYRQGDASRRPRGGAMFLVSTQAVEEAARHLRATAVLVTMSEERIDINPQLIAKAIERDIGAPWGEMHVSKHFPEHFLVRLANARHRDVAVDAGVASCRGVALSITSWKPATHGH